MIRISIDFDGTLSTKQVQDYVKNIIKREDVEIFIVTRRFENVNSYTELILSAWGINDIYEEHQYLFNVAEEVGIDVKNIHFTNMAWKWKKLKELEIDIHLDDDIEDAMYALTHTDKCYPILYTSDNEKWKEKIEYYLQIHNK